MASSLMSIVSEIFTTTSGMSRESNCSHEATTPGTMARILRLQFHEPCVVYGLSHQDSCVPVVRVSNRGVT